MKRILLIICFLFLSAQANILKGGVSEDYIPDGFFGSWGVISKLHSSNNAAVFNTESRDIWMLSGHGNILILENLESGAKSQIEIKTKSKDGKTLKFERQNSALQEGKKIVHKETVEFTLWGNNFSGTDEFKVERYNDKGDLIRTDYAKYNVAGVKISGDNPK